jgi:hypothetical protein
MIIANGGLLPMAEDNAGEAVHLESAQWKCLLGDRAKLFFLTLSHRKAVTARL